MTVEELNLCIPRMIFMTVPLNISVRNMLHAYLTALPWNNAPLFGWTEHSGAKKSIKRIINICNADIWANFTTRNYYDCEARF